jgi:diguanylate cyclase (GGDEF)-like protein/PAS domain S-box-containing protein
VSSDRPPPTIPPSGAAAAGVPEPSPGAYSRLQQQLITLQAERDREIALLTRLNRVADDLLPALGSQGVEQAIAEAIVDVLDLGIAAVWLLPDGPTPPQRFAIHGAEVSAAVWMEVGRALAADLQHQGERGARRLSAEACRALGPEPLRDGLVCLHRNRHDRSAVLLLAANSAANAALTEPIGDDSLEVLGLLASKVSALLAADADHRLIQAQVRQLQQSEQRLAAVLRGTNDGWWDLDLRDDRCFLSPRWIEMVGGQPGEALIEGPFWNTRIHPEDRPIFEATYQRALEGHSAVVDLEVRLQTDQGSFLPVGIRGTLFRDRQGRPRRFSGSMQDLTQRKSQEAQIHRLAFYDSLTDLPNRRALQERMEYSLALSQRAGDLCAAMMLDLDNFKTLNDSHGHAAGDQLLQVVAQRLRHGVRCEDVVARLGGDEFVVLLSGLGSDLSAAARRAEVVARKLIAAIAAPIRLDVGEIHQTVSIGIALAESEAPLPELLLQRADVALYQAKAAGRNTVCLFHPAMQEQLQRRSDLESRLRRGLDRREFTVAYQLQCDRDGRPVGAEALLRWPGRDGTPQSAPAEFIPVAEDAGLMQDLGEQVLEQVLSGLVAWQHQLPAGFRISLNVSAVEFQEPRFAERLLQALQQRGVPPDRLRLEITEKLVLRDLEASAAITAQLAEQGLQFSLDDFGTGYGSFSYLRTLPIHELKIDRSFVRRCLREAPDQAIVRAMLGLAKALGLRVVAEGVESGPQLEWLHQQGCDVFQGHLFDQPVTDGERPLLERLSPPPAG